MGVGVVGGVVVMGLMRKLRTQPPNNEQPIKSSRTHLAPIKALID